MNKLFLILFNIMFFIAATLFADDVLLNKTVITDFPITRGIFFVHSGSDVKAVEGLVVPFNGDERTATLWAIGTKVSDKYSNDNKIIYDLLVVGEQKKQIFHPNLSEDLSVDSAKILSPNVMQEAVNIRAAELKDLRKQHSENERQMLEVRAKIDFITEMRSVRETNELLEETNERIHNLDHNIKNLEAALQLIKNYPEPINYTKRERELTKQVGELADIARKVETEKNRAYFEGTRSNYRNNREYQDYSLPNNQILKDSSDYLSSDL